MKSSQRGAVILIVCLFLTNLGACAPASKDLATFEENWVKVSIRLEQTGPREAFLAATFTPTETGYHLYSKDIPRDGVDGLGRPTLLELTPASQMQPAGELQNDPSPLAEPLDADLPALRLYPAGPVTLRLPVILPEGQKTWSDQVSLTYMVCKDGSCRAPVREKIVSFEVNLQK